MPPTSSERVYAGPLALAHPRLTRTLEWATLSICVAMPVLSLVFRGGGSGWFAAPIAGMAAAAMAAALAWESRRATLREGEIRREPDGAIMVGKQGGRAVRLAPDALRSGVTVPHVNREEIEIALQDGRQLTLEPGSVAEGKRVLSKLGVDASRRRSRISLGGDADHRKRALLGMMALGSLLALLAQGPMSWLVFACIAVACLALVAFWTSGRAGAVALVGLDGVQIHWRGKVRFVPLVGVTGAHVRAGVELELMDGTRERLVTDYGAAKERVRALALKVCEAVRARERLGEPTSALRMLERGERSFAQWAKALRGLARDAKHYRGTAVPIEDFVAVLDDPDATVEQRIGAAFVLDGTGDPETRTRLRLAADTSASPSMRIALTAIAEATPDEDVIADALAAAHCAR